MALVIEKGSTTLTINSSLFRWLPLVSLLCRWSDINQDGNVKYYTTHHMQDSLNELAQEILLRIAVSSIESSGEPV